jgi:hypothetical protein
VFRELVAACAEKPRRRAYSAGDAKADRKKFRFDLSVWVAQSSSMMDSDAVLKQRIGRELRAE